MLRNARINWAPLTAVLLGVTAARADRGSIPFLADVLIYEPVQRAMIAWNGEEEILLLSTDLRASAPTKVLEVLPLPAEPKVTQGDAEVFRRAVALINAKLPRTRPPATGALARDLPSAPAGEVTLHERIGAHDINVIRVVEAARFVDWVGDYLRRAGVDNPQIPAPLKDVIGEYLRDGYEWFVFDVVELGTELRTNDAIQYRFASRQLYYPLRITRVEQGETDVHLLVLTPLLLSEFPGLPRSRVQLAHPPVTITGDELKDLCPDMHELLGRRATQQLRIWKINGRLDTFTADLLAK